MNNTIPVLVKDINKNITTMKKLFNQDESMNIRFIENPDLDLAIMYCSPMVNQIVITKAIIKPLTSLRIVGEFSIEEVIKKTINMGEIKITSDVSKIIEAVTYGLTIIFMGNLAEVAIINTIEQSVRAVAEPSGEKILTGPRDGFTESLEVNISLVRQRIRNNHLKIQYFTLGEITKTRCCYCFLDGVANKNLIKKLKKRMEKVVIDGVIDTNYISEMIKDSKYSIFRTTGTTERPDVISARVLEGRIAIFMDGTPSVLTVPYLFIENFQSNEDYYVNYYYATFSRLLRILGFSLSIFVPAFYISITAFHHEMLPTPLLINIANERNSVPLPASIECFILLIVFDILKEASMRMPANVGQALSIVGALVIGQSAVEAKLIAAPMVIVVAISAISELLVPKLHPSLVFIRLSILILSSMLGLYGLAIGFSALAVHIVSLKSLGVPCAIPGAVLKYKSSNDILIRFPWFILAKERRNKFHEKLNGKDVAR